MRTRQDWVNAETHRERKRSKRTTTVTKGSKCANNRWVLCSQKGIHSHTVRARRDCLVWICWATLLLLTNYVDFFYVCVCVLVSMSVLRYRKQRRNWIGNYPAKSSTYKWIWTYMLMHSLAYTRKHAQTDRHCYHNSHNIVAIKLMDKCLLYIVEYDTNQTQRTIIYFIYDFSPYFSFFEESNAMFVCDFKSRRKAYQIAFEMHCKPIDRYRMVLSEVKCKVQCMQLDKQTDICTHTHIRIRIGLICFPLKRAPEFTNDDENTL